MAFKHADNYNVVVTDSDGNTHYMFANQLIPVKLHHWQDWHCHAGYDYVYIHENGDTWAGMCQNEYLGNIYNGSVQLLADPTVCKQKNCTDCTTDLSVEKYKPYSGDMA
jgi:hypothetical protein